MNAEKALKIEKYLRVHDPNFNFLYSPTTRVADNKGIMKTLVQYIFIRNPNFPG